MIKKRILLFGGSGLLGTRIIELLSEKYLITFPSKSDVNLEDKKQIEEFIDIDRFDFIIYAAGETNQERAEVYRDRAILLNSTSVGWVAKIAARLNIPLIYFSSDAVFSGKEVKYKETDLTNPINYYGLTKKIGENNVLSASSRNLIIRMTSVYSSKYAKKMDFVRSIIFKLSNNLPCYGILDQHFNPILSDNVIEIVDKCLYDNISGIIHLGSRDVVDNLSFTRLLAQKLGFNTELVTPITFDNFYKDKKNKYLHHKMLDVSKSIELFGLDSINTNDKNLTKFVDQLN